MVLGLASTLSAGQIQLLTNGGFETGDFTGWNTGTEAGSNGSLSVQSGTTGPNSGLSNVGPASGSFFALTDQGGPGAYALAQSFTVDANATDVVLSFDLFANDYAGVVDPGTLDYTSGPRQFATADLLVNGANIFSTAGADVIQNFYSGADGGANPNPYTHYSFDITGLVAPGGTYQIRFGEADNQLFFNMGVDNVSVEETTTPEPASFLLLGSALAGVALLRRKKSA
jgi:hypothetical protein